MIHPSDHPYVLFQNNGGLGTKLIKCLSVGLKMPYTFYQDYWIRSSIHYTPHIWGILRGSGALINYASQRGINFYHYDHAYINRGHKSGNYRITSRQLNLSRLRVCGPSKLTSLNTRLVRWRSHGSHILISPPTPNMISFLQLDGWLDRTIAQLKKYTDRPLKIRYKGTSTPLDEDLKDCFALVTHQSNIAVDAVLSGIPVYVPTSSACYSVSSGPLSAIEYPKFPDRELLINNISHSQYSLHHFVSGHAFQAYREYLEFPFL